jgi:hypothetical protein
MIRPDNNNAGTVIYKIKIQKRPAMVKVKTTLPAPGFDSTPYYAPVFETRHNCTGLSIDRE